MSIVIRTFITAMSAVFENFNEFIATRIVDGIFRALAEKMHKDLSSKGSSRIILPWGTYSAEVKAAGEAGNITPTWEPSKAFVAALNADTDAKRERRQDTFDPEYVQLFKDYVAYGYFYPEEVKDRPAREKGLRMSDDEVEFFLNEFMGVLVTIGRDKQRPGKVYRLEVDDPFPHGSFDFDYSEDGNVKVTFSPHKAFKQYLKDDTVAGLARDADFTPIHETTCIKIPKTA